MRYQRLMGLLTVVPKSIASMLLIGTLTIASWGDEAATVRVVPNMPWPAEGVLSADKQFGAAIRLNRLMVVDVKRGRLAYLTELSGGVSIPVFSPDGRFLVACSKTRGVLLDLTTFRESNPDFLVGSAVGFTADGKHVLLASSYRSNRKANLKVLDFKGKTKKEYQLEMVVARSIEAKGDKVTIVGLGGMPYSAATGLGYKVTQTLHLDTGATHTVEDRNQKWLNKEGLSKLPACKLKKHYGNWFNDLYLDKSSGIAAVRGKGRPEGGVVKTWNVYKGRFLGTLGTQNQVEPVGFVRAEVLRAHVWSEGKKKPMDINLLDGDRTEARSEVGKPYPGNIHAEDCYGGRPKPIPLKNGKYLLQAEGTTMRLHLIRKSDERRLVTYLPFEGNTWIVHTTEGNWSGSDDVLSHVSFYRGRKLLPSTEVKKLRRPKRIEAFLGSILKQSIKKHDSRQKKALEE